MPGPHMTTCRANVGVAVVKNKLYAAGGFSGKNFLNSVEYLDPDTDEWTNFTPKPELVKNIKSSVNSDLCKENGHRTSSFGVSHRDSEEVFKNEGLTDHIQVENGCNGITSSIVTVAATGQSL
ncbi:hypothetical protein SK128_004373 [Halocaridina rubra]|uniref:Uncharacterized protein n=1 Tax=Halocaridina rubra TaxID=373956 RepID=A0AAN8WC28_HALRR